ASDADELPVLAALADNARRNGARDVALVDARELLQAEPALRAHGALWSPSSGVVDVHALMDALLAQLRAAGGELVLGQRVVGLTRAGAGWTLELGASGKRPDTPSPAPAERSVPAVERVPARFVVNACGHDAPAVARMAGVDL